jgi:hypothetical protein
VLKLLHLSCGDPNQLLRDVAGCSELQELEISAHPCVSQRVAQISASGLLALAEGPCRHSLRRVALDTCLGPFLAQEHAFEVYKDDDEVPPKPLKVQAAAVLLCGRLRQLQELALDVVLPAAKGSGSSGGSSGSSSAAGGEAIAQRLQQLLAQQGVPRQSGFHVMPAADARSAAVSTVVQGTVGECQVCFRVWPSIVPVDAGKQQERKAAATARLARSSQAAADEIFSEISADVSDLEDESDEAVASDEDDAAVYDAVLGGSYEQMSDEQHTDSSRSRGMARWGRALGSSSGSGSSRGRGSSSSLNVTTEGEAEEVSPGRQQVGVQMLCNS